MMMLSRTSIVLGLAVSAAAAMAQERIQPAWRAQSSPVTVELRGLAVVSDRIAWASGAKGTVIRTTDGETWNVIPVLGAEKLDFRDIEAWDEKTAVAMSIGPGEASNVFKTKDGGATWRRVFVNPDPKGFWDAITFWDRKHGALFGDPVGGKFQVYTTDDGGESWQRVPDAGLPPALENEGAFAASGSCLASGPGKRLAFVSGGAAVARVFVSTDQGRTFTVSTSPIPAGAASKGLFSVAWLDDQTLVIVGGDYKEPALSGARVALSIDGGSRWSAVDAAPGFLSSVAMGSGKPTALVAVGLAGTGLSLDGGKTWTAEDAAPYNTVAFARGKNAPVAGWAVGPKGVIARWYRGRR
jgi:photosystem II stability/assembly factor-like uncharacterized protein